MLVINIFGAPGAGKSTLAHTLTGFLKKCHVSCELANEYAKDIVLDRSPHFLTNQFRILGEQSWRVERIAESGADCTITDSPVALVGFFATHLYPERYSENFANLVMQAHREWNSLDYFLLRNHPYESRGRFQSETESDALASKMEKWLEDNGLAPMKIETSDLITERVFCEIVASGKISIPALGRNSARRIAATLLSSSQDKKDADIAAAAISVLA